MCFVMKYHVICNTNHAWGPLESRDIATLIKHVFLQKSFGVMIIFEKSNDDYIEWCSQNTKRISVGSCYEHSMIL